VTAPVVTDAVKADFRSVLKETRDLFGSHQRATYKQLIVKAVQMVAGEPERAGSWDKGGIVPGLRALHLELAAGRSGAAAHMLYYAVERPAKGPPRVVILRLLHESMEPRLHLARTSLAVIR